MYRQKFLLFLKRIYQRLILFLATVFVTFLVSLNSLINRVRMSHENGITCLGQLEIVSDPEFPDHPFFTPGRQFACRVRHAAASFLDDAKLVVRSASVKFADSRKESPMDVLMNSGQTPLFWDARTFLGFMKVSTQGRGKFYTSFLRTHPNAAFGGGDAVRRNPDSFSKMSYNSKTATGFIGNDGVYRYARYRLIPADWNGVDSGTPDEFDRTHSWLQNPYRDESRNRNYLKEELREYLEAGNKVHYKLQIQLREKPNDGSEQYWLSCALPWDETRFPFMDLAHLELEQALSYEESTMTQFRMSNHPDSLPVPGATSIDDPNSLNLLRLQGVWARRTRLLAYRLFGMPKAFPDSRKNPDWVGIPPLRDPP